MYYTAKKEEYFSTKSTRVMSLSETRKLVVYDAVKPRESK